MVKITDVVVEQGLSVGAIYAVAQIAKRLGIEKVLGKTQEGKLALWQVIARVLEQGSRLSAVRMAQLHCVMEVLDFKKGFTENDLYKNLGWIAEKQDKFEKKLFDERYPQGKKPVLFLYDVTSSYLEGTQNEFARYGYNRDKKQGKKQIVIGFLSDENGKGISVEVFEGNTSDPKTVLDQIHKIAQRFGCERVTFVGDRGMLKSQNLEDLKAQEFSYITGITKSQIQKLINDGKLQLGLFDIQLKEEVADGVRYIYRMNPVRAQEIAKTRKEKLQKIELWIERLNTYLTEHSRAKVETAVRNIEKMLERYGLLSGQTKKSYILDIRACHKSNVPFGTEKSNWI